MKMIKTMGNISKFLASCFDGNAAKAFALSVVLFSVVACSDPPGDIECVEADDWGDTVNISLKVPANQEYTSAGIKVKQDDPLKIEVSGLVDICPDSVNLGPTGSTNATVGSKPIDATVDTWQDSGIAVKKGDKLSIAVSGTYHDRTGDQDSGKGLYVLIVPNGADGKAGSPTAEQNSRWWYGALGAPQYSTNAKAGDDTDYPEFFELYDNGTVGSEGAGFAGTAPKDGQIYFRYARTASARGLSNTGDSDARYSPWMGEYAWRSECSACYQSEIIAVCAAVGAASFGIGTAVCLPAWQGGCAATGDLEEVYRTDAEKQKASKSGKNCREHYAYQDLDDSTNLDYKSGGRPGSNVISGSGNHWIDNAYDGSESDGYLGSDTANSGGYEISITKGCTGTYGRYMDMDIGFSKATLVDKTEPAGCDVSDTANCQVSVDSWNGLPVKVPVYSVPGANFTSMDLRFEDGHHIDNLSDPPYTSEGVYGGEDSAGKVQGKVPSSGELWFHIKDNASTLKHPEPYYGDNVGEYTVKIKTTKVSDGFSSTMQKLIDPIKGLVFGYCRIEDNSSTSDVNEAELRYQLDKTQCGSAWLPGLTERMYNTLVGGTIDPKTSQLAYDSTGQAVMTGGVVTGNPFINVVRASLVLYIIIYGGLFMMGMTQDAQAGFLKRVAKFAVVVAVISPGSWNFFSVYMFNAFTRGVDELIGMMSGVFSGVVSTVLMNPITGEVVNDPSGQAVSIDKNIFAFADQTLTLVFSKEAFIKLSSLIFQTPVGILYFIIVLVGMLIFLMGLLKALVLYLLAMLSISLMLIVAPIFMSMLLFERTARYFDNWFKFLLNYALQPVFVFVALSIFNIFVYSSIYSLLHFRACWDVVYRESTFNIPIFYFYLPDTGEGLGSVPITMFQIFIFMIICHGLFSFVDWMAELAAHITTTQRSTSLAKAAQAGITQVTSMAKKGGGSVLKVATQGSKGLKEVVGKGVSKTTKRK